MADCTQHLDRFLETHLEKYIDETARLCAQPSISASGEGVHACGALVAETFRQHGLDVQVFETPGAPIVVGHARGTSESTMLFYNHYDVQPPEPLDLWTSPPFEPTMRDGKLFARGASDDKGQLVARLAALDAVRAAHNGTLPCGVTFVAEGEEEIGSPHLEQFVLDHLSLLQGQAAIWETGGINSDGRAIMRFGVRGVMCIELRVRTLSRDAHSGDAHALPNAAWRMIDALNLIRNPDGYVNIPGFYDDVIPPSARDIVFFEAMPDPEAELRQYFGVRHFVNNLHGVDLARAVFAPTSNICGFVSGYGGEGSKTVIPSEAMVKLDFRLVPDQDPDIIFANLRAYLDDNGFDDVELISEGPMWPARVDPDAPVVQLSAAAAEDVYGKPCIFSPMVGGSSPVYTFVRPMQIPVLFPGIAYWDNRIHAPDEHIRLVDFLNGARHIARILDGFADL